MALCLKSGLCISGSRETVFRAISKGDVRLCPIGSSQFTRSNSKDFLRKPLFVAERKGFSTDLNAIASTKVSIRAQSSVCVSRALRWWEKFPLPNIIEIHSAQQLVGSLLSAGDGLVVVDFYSPSCGGCKALHPKICQLAESNPDAIFLKVNYEEHKKMCHSLHIHVLPFFRFYRGAEGKLCSFSCTNATIKKFKDALAKHGTERCSLGPAKGVDESELLSLASMGEGSINLPIPPSMEDLEGMFLRNLGIGVLGKTGNGKMGIEEKKSAMLMA